MGPLSLSTSDRIDMAVKILNDIKVSYSTTTGMSKDRLRYGLLDRAQPPVIALRGLAKGKGNYFPLLKKLECFISEPEPFLAGFRSLFVDAFVTAGLMPEGLATGWGHERTQKMMSTMFLTTKVPNGKRSLRAKGATRSPYLDVSDLQPKHQDTQWTEYFPLEKVYISELGLQDLYRDGDFVEEAYRDIACVPLPGVSATDICAARSDDVYTKARRAKYKNYPVTSMVIPSTPPA
ncbi:MAG: hypothetical protein Q9168_002973 [Polycauliona sp. 1 TL-2023]